MDWKHLRCVALLLNRHRDRSFGADWAKREAALVGGLFHFIHRALNAAIASSRGSLHDHADTAARAR